MTPLPAFLYGHYACPHTYIAQGRLDLLAAEAPVRVTWRPLVPPIDPPPDWRAITGDASSAAEARPPGEVGPPSEAGPAANVSSAANALAELRRDAAGLGMTLDLPAAPPATGDALQAAEFARDCGPELFQRFHRALFRAVFVDGVDIGQRATLLDLGASVGLDNEGLGTALEDRRYEAILREAEAEADRYAINATPTILLGRFKLVGAAPLDVLRQTLARLEHDAEADDDRP